MRVLHGVAVGVVACVLLGPLAASAQAVRAELASLLEAVAEETGLSMNISGATTTSIEIDRVGGRPVCAPEARADVEKLQRAFDAHPQTWRNIGPALVVVTDADGEKVYGDLGELQRAGVLEGCPDVHIAVRE